MKRKFSIADYITSIRILGAAGLIFTELFSDVFYVIYTICGISDALDGLVARATKTASEFGAKLDSVADLFFYTVVIIKWVPYLWSILPAFIWAIACVALVIRIASYLVAFLKHKKFASLHTYLNKLNGFVFFFLPYLIAFEINTVTVCAVICVIAAVASLEELCIHASSSVYHGARKTILKKS